MDVQATAEAVATIVTVIAAHLTQAQKRAREVAGLRRALTALKHQVAELRERVERWSDLP